MSFMPLLENEEEGLSWASRACGLGFLGFRDWVIDPRVSEGGVWMGFRVSGLFLGLVDGVYG